MKKKNKITASIIAILMLTTGTFAWQSFSQLATNELLENVDTPGGRVHDYFNGFNKDVFVENYATGDNAPNIFARVRISEYYEYGKDAGSMDAYSSNITVVRGDVQNVSMPVLGEPDTWDIYSLSAEENMDENIRLYRSLEMGGSTIFMPTFNRDNTDLNADVKGTFRDENGNVKDEPYDDYKTYTIEDTEEGMLITADNPTGILANHNAKNTNDAEIITMENWLKDGAPIGDYWVFDTTGWAYYARAIEPGEASGLLLDGITIEQNPKSEWYYAVDVTAQLATAGDWGDEPKDDESAGTGMYEDQTTEALGLLNKISGITKATNMNIIDADGKVLEPSDLQLDYTSSLPLDISLDVVNGVGIATESDVEWTVTEISDPEQIMKSATSGSGLDQDELNSKIQVTEDSVIFKPVLEMAGYYYDITATSKLASAASVSIRVYIYDHDSIEVFVKDDVPEVKAETSVDLYAYYKGTTVTAPVSWSVTENTGSSSLDSIALNATISDNGVFKPITAMAGGQYSIIATPNKPSGLPVDVVLSVFNVDTVDVNVASDESNLSLSSNQYTMQMSSDIVGLINQGVTWSIGEQGTSIKPNLSGAIDSQTGLFTATDAMMGGTYRITATSVLDSSIKGYKDITVNSGIIQLTGDNTVNIGSSVTIGKIVTGCIEDSVTWSIAKKSGSSTITPTISTSGAFTPVAGMAGNVYTVTAKLTSNNAVVSTKDIMVNTGTLTVSSSSTIMTLSSSLYTMQMSAITSNLGVTGVTWSIAEEGTNINPSLSGVINSTSGLLTATDAMIGGTYRVTATSIADGSVQNYKDITINDGSIELSGSTTVDIGSSVTIGKTVTGVRSDAITWSIAKKSGSSTATPTISTAGVFTPVSGMAGGVYTVTGKVTSNNTLVSTRDITVNTGTVTVSSSAASMTLSSSSYTMQMSAVTSNLGGTGVAWSIAEEGTNINPSLSGVINSTSGLLTATDAMIGGTYRITATSTADGNVKNYKDITIAGGTISLSGNTTVNIGSSVTVGKTVTGVRSDAITWSVTKKSGSSSTTPTISTGGVFTPVSGMAGGVYTVTGKVTSNNTLVSTRDITVNTGSVSVSSANNAASMTLSSTAYTLQMSATVSNITGTGMTWTVTESSGDSGLTEADLNATISSSGLFTPVDAMTGGSYIIKATSTVDTTKSNTKTISIAKATISVSVANSSKFIQAGKTLQFSTTITGLRSSATTWTRSGQSSSSTTITSSGGLLSVNAAETVGGTITIKAACSTKSSITASTSVSVDTSSANITSARGTNTAVTLGGESFYVLNTATINSKSAAKLVTASQVKSSVYFGTTSTYTGSTVETQVNSWFNTWLAKTALTDSSIVTGSYLVGVSSGSPTLLSTQKAFLLSTTEMSAMLSTIRGTGSGYWLRTIYGSASAYYTYSAPSTSYIYGTATVADTARAVRPALWIYL